MFGKLFKRNAENSEPAVAVLEEVDETPMPNLATMLILAMTSWIEQNEVASGQLVPVIPEVRQAYDRLLKIGMGQTQNARALRVQIEAADNAALDQLKARNLIIFIKEAQEHFGPRTVLVSYTAFNDLCERYGLTIGALADYCGVIPERNVQDIENVMSKIMSFKFMGKLNHKEGMSDRNHYIYVTGADLYYGHEPLAEFIKEHDNVVQLRKAPSPYYTPDHYGADDISGYYGKGYDSCLSHIYGTLLTPKTLFIACPKQYLKNTDIKIQPKPVDPAVFQFTPYGILVHTIWGEEAEDVAFKEFMDLNLRIAKS